MAQEQSAANPAPDVQPVGLLPLWFGVLAGPAAWTLQELVSYYLVSINCGGVFGSAGLLGIGLFWILLWAVTLLSAAVTIIAGVVAWRNWRASGVGTSTAIGGAAGRSGYMALAGVILGCMFTLIILAGAIAPLGLSACGV